MHENSMLKQATRRSALVGMFAALAFVVAAPNGLSASLPSRVAITRKLRKWQCANQDCEPYIYDPSLGAENINDEANPIPPGVAFEELPEDWVCPVCGDPKSSFLPMRQWVAVSVSV